MKKFFAIITSSLILITGMHLSVAKHYCGGEIAEIKISVEGESATCGMEEVLTCEIHNVNGLSEECCSNELTSLGVDQNYSPSEHDNKLIRNIALAQFVIFQQPSGLTNDLTYNYKSIFPPGKVLTGSKSRADICVFRI